MVILCSASAALGSALVNHFYNKEPPISKQLIELSEMMNQSAPQTLDSETQLDSTMALGNTFFYRYTLINYSLEELDIPQFKNSMEPQLFNRYCNSEDSKVFVKNDVSVRHSYHGKNGKQIYEVEFKAKDCENS